MVEDFKTIKWGGRDIIGFGDDGADVDGTLCGDPLAYASDGDPDEQSAVTDEEE